MINLRLIIGKNYNQHKHNMTTTNAITRIKMQNHENQSISRMLKACRTVKEMYEIDHEASHKQSFFEETRKSLALLINTLKMKNDLVYSPNINHAERKLQTINDLGIEFMDNHLFEYEKNMFLASLECKKSQKIIYA